MIPAPRYVMTTAMAMPAITAPPPRPSSTKSAASLIGYSTIGCVVSWRRAGSTATGYARADSHPSGGGRKSLTLLEPPPVYR